MCRLLAVKSNTPFESASYLQKFAEIARTSKEFQGHGWGLAIRKDGQWSHYRNISPIWKDNLTNFGQTTELLAHARSAFQDEGITVENNMPFFDDRYVFIFNGELRGVKIKEEGRIGAEKIFNFIKRMNHGDMLESLKNGIKIITSRTKKLRAMNVIISDSVNLYVSCKFAEDPDYFTLRYKEGNSIIICSEPFIGENDWKSLENNQVRIFKLC